MISVAAMTKEDYQEVCKNPIGPDSEYAVDAEGFTLRADGRIIMVGGVRWFWEGVGEAWCILHARSQGCRFTTYRALKILHTTCVNRYKPFNRVQATVRTQWPEAIKMLEKLGYKREGLLRKYCPDGEDVYMYAMVGP